MTLWQGYEGVDLSEFPLMIFAAGFGTRMGKLTHDKPKPMIEVGGVPLIDRALDLATDAGAGPVVVNTHYKAEVLEHHLKTRDVVVTREAPRILDTGGGLKHALPLLPSQSVATLNPDAIWLGENPLRVLWQNWNRQKMDALLLCVPLERTRGRNEPGDFDVDAEGRISRPGSLVYGGAQIIRADRVAEVPGDSFSLNVVWNRLLLENRLCFAVYDGAWCDVGTPAGLALAERAMVEDV